MKKIPHSIPRDVIFLQFGLVISLFLYFTRFCPLIVFDSDDWIYLSAWRIPVPIWHGWNPSRVTPETLLPLSGWLGAHIFYPLTGDYISAITVGGAVLVTFFASFMCWYAYLFASERLKLNAVMSSLFEVLFLTLMFLIFRNRGGSRNLFTAADYSCVFFYTVSGMLNASLVMLLMTGRDYEQKFRNYSLWKKILFWVLAYAAIFSNLFHSGITAVYCGLHLLDELIRYLRGRGKSGRSSDLLKRNWIHLTLLAGWLLSVIFEANGGRAESVDSGRKAAGSTGFVQTLRQFKALLEALSWPYLMITGVAFLAAIVTLIRVKHGSGESGETNEKSEYVPGKAEGSCSFVKRIVITIVSNLILLTLYQLVLNTETGYMSRIDATWGIWFWCVLLTDLLLTGGIHYIRLYETIRSCENRDEDNSDRADRSDSAPYPNAQKHTGKRTAIIVGCAALAFCITFSILPDGKYMCSTRDLKGYDHSRATSEYLYEQVVSASKHPDVMSDFYIPDYRGTELEWAISDGIGTNISETLLKQGIIENIPQLHVIYDASLN